MSKPCSPSVRSSPAAFRSFSRAQTMVLPSLPAPSSPRPQGCQAPPVWKPSGIGRAPPKRPGVWVAGLTVAVGGQACTWEGREEPAAATGDCGSNSPFLSLPCHPHLQTPEGQTKKPNGHSGWATGLPHCPPPPTPLSTFPSQPEGSVIAKQDKRPVPPALSSS